MPWVFIRCVAPHSWKSALMSVVFLVLWEFFVPAVFIHNEIIVNCGSWNLDSGWMGIVNFQNMRICQCSSCRHCSHWWIEIPSNCSHCSGWWIRIPYEWHDGWLLEYASNAATQLACMSAFSTCHTHLLMHHCSSADIIVSPFRSLWLTSLAKWAMHQKYAANSPVVISFFIISPVYDLNCTIVDQFMLLSPTSHFQVDDLPSLVQAIV